MAADNRKSGMADGPKEPKEKRRVPKVGEITKSTGKPRRSPNAKSRPKANQTSWRRKLQVSRIKFDDIAKEIFLEAFRQNNLKMRACEQAGVSLVTVNDHLKNDLEFAEAYDQAVQDWRDYVVETAIVKIALEGVEVKKFDKDGNVVEERRDHPVQLLLAELRRVDPGYRDKSTLDVNSGGGVLVAPADMTPATWMKQQQLKNEDRKNPMLEIEHKVVETLDGDDDVVDAVPVEQVVRG